MFRINNASYIISFKNILKFFYNLKGQSFLNLRSLSNSRTAGFSGPNPITYEQIKAWKELTNTVVSTRDIAAIMSIDRVYMRVANG